MTKRQTFSNDPVSQALWMLGFNEAQQQAIREAVLTAYALTGTVVDPVDFAIAITGSQQVNRLEDDKC